MKSFTSNVTSKGQVTIPVTIREKFKIQQGSKVEFIIKNDSVLIVPINKSVKSLKNILPKPKNSLTIKQINNIIKQSYDRD